MEAAAKGARSAGGITLGILSGKDRVGMSDAIDIPVVTGMSDARNVIIIRSADGVLAIGGAFGTLSEVGFALRFSKPLVGIKTWKLDHPDKSKVPQIPAFSSSQEAVDALFDFCTAN